MGSIAGMDCVTARSRHIDHDSVSAFDRTRPEMARVTCRCGETFKVPSTDPDRLVCPRCGAKIRVRRDPSAPRRRTRRDRRRLHPVQLPVRAAAEGAGRDRARGGQVPRLRPGRAGPRFGLVAGGRPCRPRRDSSGRARPDARTEDMDAADLARLEPGRAATWAGRCPAERRARSAPPRRTRPIDAVAASSDHREAGRARRRGRDRGRPAGLPRCGKPVHISATVCRNCGDRCRSA